MEAYLKKTTCFKKSNILRFSKGQWTGAIKYAIFILSCTCDFENFFFFIYFCISINEMRVYLSVIAGAPRLAVLLGEVVGGETLEAVVEEELLDGRVLGRDGLDDLLTNNTT